jgi:uncharacterized membrane protein
LTVVLFFAVTLMRLDSLWRDRGSVHPRIHWFRLAALLLALLGETVLLVTASRGGAAVYRHGVGVQMQDDANGSGEH